MSHVSRRQILKGAATALAGNLQAADEDFEIQIAPVSARTFRLSAPSPAPNDGTLLRDSFGAPVAKLRRGARAQTIKCGELKIQFTPEPLSFAVEGAPKQT